MENLNVIINIIEGLSALTVVLLFCVKPFRKWFLSSKQKEKEESERVRDDIEVKKCLLRSDILEVYYSRRMTGEIYSYEFENVSFLYKAYKKLGGNSFIDKVWNEMQEWRIVP